MRATILFGPPVNPRLRPRAKRIGPPIKQIIVITGGKDMKKPSKEYLALFEGTRYSCFATSVEVGINSSF
jgi:hypothetical protein